MLRLFLTLAIVLTSRYLLTIKNLSQRDSPEQPLVGEAGVTHPARGLGGNVRRPPLSLCSRTLGTGTARNFEACRCCAVVLDLHTSPYKYAREKLFLSNHRCSLVRRRGTSGFRPRTVLRKCLQVLGLLEPPFRCFTWFGVSSTAKPWEFNTHDDIILRHFVGVLCHGHGIAGSWSRCSNCDRLQMLFTQYGINQLDNT